MLVRLLVFVAAFVTVGGCAASTPQKNAASVLAVSRTDRNAVEADQLIAFDLPERTQTDTDGKSAWTDYGRLGMWFNEWSGMALDSSYRESGGPSVANYIVSVTPMLVIRAQLFKSDRAPDGYVQPYFGIGPGLFLPDQEADIGSRIRSNADSTRIAVGIDLRAGLRWHVSDNVGVFGEYRLTHYKAGDNSGSDTTFHSDPYADSTRTTSRVLGGLAFRF